VYQPAAKRRFPLDCPKRGDTMKIIAFNVAAEAVRAILACPGEAPSSRHAARRCR
jgi:hypothetical protein